MDRENKKESKTEEERRQRDRLPVMLRRRKRKKEWQNGGVSSMALNMKGQKEKYYEMWG